MWEHFSQPARGVKRSHHRIRIRNCATSELLYTGSKLLDPHRRYALTWTGAPQEDPAMLWELVLGSGALPLDEVRGMLMEGVGITDAAVDALPPFVVYG